MATGEPKTMIREYFSFIVFTVLLLGVASHNINAAKKDWVHPGKSPVHTTIDTLVPIPMSTNATGEIKKGGLIINSTGNTDSLGFAVARGKVGIGTDNPSLNLDVEIAGKLGADVLCNLKSTPDCLTLADFKSKIENRSSTPSGDPMPLGAISMFSDTCPAGWDEYTDINGKFPRGVRQTENLSRTDQIFQGYRCPNTSRDGCSSQCQGQLWGNSNCERLYKIRRWYGRRCEGRDYPGCPAEYKSVTTSWTETYGVGQQGGSEQHSHSAGYSSDRELSGRNSLRLIVSSVSPESNVPPYKDLVFCKKR